MRNQMMASTSMSPLSRPTKAPDPDVANVHATTTQPAVMTQATAPPPEALDPRPLFAKMQPPDDDDDDDEDEDDDDEESKAIAAGNDDAGDRVHQQNRVARHCRECERGRVLAILESEAGKKWFSSNPERALRFALTHSGTRQEAIATLELMADNLQPTARIAPLRERMEGNNPVIGPDGAKAPQDEKAAMAQAIILAGKKRRGEVA